VDIYEFEKTELNSQEEMEKQARLYAEAELQRAKMDNQVGTGCGCGCAAQFVSAPICAACVQS
jgi:hypothetical protein